MEKDPSDVEKLKIMMTRTRAEKVANELLDKLEVILNNEIMPKKALDPYQFLDDIKEIFDKGLDDLGVALILGTTRSDIEEDEYEDDYEDEDDG